MATLSLPSVPKTAIGFDPSDPSDSDDDNSPPASNPNFKSRFEKETFDFYHGISSESEKHFLKHKKRSMKITKENVKKLRSYEYSCKFIVYPNRADRHICGRTLHRLSEDLCTHHFGKWKKENNLTRPYTHYDPFSIQHSIPPPAPAPVSNYQDDSPNLSPLSHLNIDDDIDPTPFCSQDDRDLAKRVENLKKKQA